MLNTLIVCLLFAIKINAEVVPTSSSFNITEELEKISETCLTCAEHDELTGNKFKKYLAAFFDNDIIEQSVYIIGNSEIRKALGFQPPGPWNTYEKPTPEQLNAASSLEEYFKLKTSYDVSRVAKLNRITEKDFATAIQFLDKRLPAIRMIFRMETKEFLRKNQGKIDRKMVDELIDENYYIFRKLRESIKEMNMNMDCRKAEMSLEDASELLMNFSSNMLSGAHRNPLCN